ncbi:MAG TPA: hypothetical protein VF392_00440 [Terracidiphilus sp.]
MGRIRTVKPEFNSNEGLSSLSAAAHLLAEALLCYADDEGYFNANPVLVRAGTCPLRKDFKNISKLLKELASVGYVRFGDFEGKRFGKIVTFKTHQKISHPATSKINRLNIIWENPPENSGEAPNFSREAPENSGGAPEPLRPEQGTGNREQGTGGADSGGTPESASPLVIPPDSRTAWKNRGMMRPVNQPAPLSDEAHMIASAVIDEIGVTTSWARDQIAQQADQELKKFPDDMDGIRAGMAGAWKEYSRLAAAGKLVKAPCGPEKFYGEGRWRSPKLWGLKPGARAYETPSAA